MPEVCTQTLGQLPQSFSIIAVSEPRLHTGKGLDFELDGYETICKNTESNDGGGVALFMAKNLLFTSQSMQRQQESTMCLNVSQLKYQWGKKEEHYYKLLI